MVRKNDTQEKQGRPISRDMIKAGALALFKEKGR